MENDLCSKDPISGVKVIDMGISKQGTQLLEEEWLPAKKSTRTKIVINISSELKKIGNP